VNLRAPLRAGTYAAGVVLVTLGHAWACLGMPLADQACRGMPAYGAPVMEFRANEYRWVQVYELLKERILTGVYKPDLPIPSEPRLEEELGVARRTARKAVHRLREEGLVYTKPNLGNFVAPRRGEPDGPPR
jgi:GntR family transcriptional regulator